MVVATRRMTAPLPLPPPPDLKAHPSEEELIASFLRPRASASSPGDDGPCAFIHDADVYSADPAELTAEFAPAVASNGDGAWYFFSAVRAKSCDGHRKARTVDTGKGSWHSEAGAKPVVDDAGRYLGHRQSFSFVTKVDGRRVRSGWLMVELSLDDGRGGGATDMVLCKIYFSPRARINGRASAPSWSSSLAGRKRKVTATGNNRNNPASAARQQRRRGASSKTEAGAQAHDDDVTDDDEGEEISTTQGGGEVAAGSSAGGEEEDLGTDEPFSWSWSFKDRDRTMKELNIVVVDRSDEELLETLGLTSCMKTLNSFHYGDDMDPQLRKA